MKTLPFCSLALLMTLSGAAAQAETACIAPTAIIVPASFANISTAEVTETSVEAYLTASGQYQKCLNEERTALGESITAKQDAELTSLKAAAKGEAKAIAETYNTAVGALHGG